MESHFLLIKLNYPTSGLLHTSSVNIMLFCFQVEGSRSRKTSLFYIGKRVAFVFKGKSKKSSPTNPKHKSRVRAIWGKVTRLHGNNGSVRARFTKNLPGDAIGKRVRIVSKPSTD